MAAKNPAPMHRFTVGLRRLDGDDNGRPIWGPATMTRGETARNTLDAKAQATKAWRAAGHRVNPDAVTIVKAPKSWTDQVAAGARSVGETWRNMGW